MQFVQGQIAKSAAIGAARKIGELGGVDNRTSGGQVRVHVTHCERADFGPLAVDERDHGPINAQDQGVWRTRRGRMLAQDAGGFGGFVGHQQGTRRLSAPPYGIGMHMHPGKPGQFVGCAGK